MPYLRNAIIFLVPLIGFAALQVAAAPLREEILELRDGFRASISYGFDSPEYYAAFSAILVPLSRLGVYTFSVFVLCGVVAGILIPNRIFAKQTAISLMAMSIGIGAALILFGVDHMYWSRIALDLGFAVLFAIGVVWIKTLVAALWARLRVQ
jgi:hypothetical protein